MVLGEVAEGHPEWEVGDVKAERARRDQIAEVAGHVREIAFAPI